MDGGGNMQSPEERGAERLMDDYLKSIGLHRKKIAKDGSCLFRAVAEQVLHCQSLHTKVRARCVEFLKQNREIYEAFIEGDFEDYLYKLQDPQQWVGEVEINALAVMYKRDFLIFQEPGKPAVNITDNNFKDKVRLCFLNGNHYDSVYPISHIKNAALCQSVLYELLYDGVFKVDRGSLGPCQRMSRPSDVLSDDSMPLCGSSDESDLDAGDALWVENGTSTTTTRHQSYRGRGRGRHLPERVRRSLNPTLFRNIEYDVWHKTKRAQQKMDYCIAAGMQFTVGDRCQVRLEGGGRSYNATIKEVSPNNGPVTVYIEDLGKKQVPLWSLRPPQSDENSWSTVVNRDKRLSNGHGDWEERGKGRGRGKQHVPASSSVSQATAPGSSGRVLKQHSWPPQATVEEQAVAKANRSLKSVSSVEAAFGLTEEQRLAKEEEERNVALVEIQLRDENSFPALGVQSGMQGDGGKKKGGEKRRSQRNKTKSPVEDVRAESPSAGERPKSSTPPLSAAPTTQTTTPTNPSLPPAKPPAAPSADSNPGWLSSLKASTPNINVVTTAAGAVSSSTSTSAAPVAKSNAPSYALATGASPSSPPPPAAAPTTKLSAVPPSVPSSASLFSFHTPTLPAASSPPTPHAGSSSTPPPASSTSKPLTSSSSSLPPKSSASPPPYSSLPPPTFIAPIAPSPNAAAQGFLPRSSPPVSSLSHSPSPPSSSSSSSVHHAAQVPEAPPASAQSPNSLPNIGGTPTAAQTFQSHQIHPQGPLPQTQTQTQTSVPHDGNQTQPPLSTNPTPMPQVQPEAQSSLAHLQHQPQSHTEGASLPQTHIHPSVPQPQYLSQPQPEVAQSFHPASYPHTSQASVSQPPHPSQVPHPCLSLSASPTHPSHQSQSHNTQTQTEVPLPPAQPLADSPAHGPSQQSHPPPPHPSHPLHLQSALPPLLPQPQSIPGTVPLQQLSQLYQDPLYPGFPQREKGDVAPTPSFSNSKSGEDLPKDVNILRFFYNLGLKAYSMPMFPPYIYLLPLQQAHTMHPKLHSRSPSPSPTPHYPPSNPPARPQEAYPHPQYPQTSASMPPQYETPLPEPPRPLSDRDPSFNQPGYPVAQPPPHGMSGSSLPWQQHQMPPPRNPGFPVEYSTQSPPYPGPPPLSQGYHLGQAPGHPPYPQSAPLYPPSSLGYQSPSAPEELQVSQGAMEQRQPANGDTMPGGGHGRVRGPAAVSMANANNRTVMVPGFALKKEPGESLPRSVLLVDPPLNNTPILISNPGVKDVPVSMTTMKTGSTSSGSPLPYDLISKTTVPGDGNPSRGYRGHHKPLHPSGPYVPLGPPEPGQVSYLPAAAMAEVLSVGCSTEDSWEETIGGKQTTLNHRGPKRSYRGGGGGGRGGGGHDRGRMPYRRRHGGEGGAGLGYVQFNSSSSSYRGRGRERGY